MAEALAPQFEHYEPSFVPSAALAMAVHLLLAAILVFGVRWQWRPLESVMVELWEPSPPVAEAPRIEPPAEPRPAPKPEPVVEPPKPDIAVTAPPPKAVVKPKPEPRPEPRPAALPREDVQKRLREELAREQQAMSTAREKQDFKARLEGEQAAAAKKSMDIYAGRIRGKIRGNIVTPPDVKGNPEAIFDVIQLPTGEVLSVKLRKSSGHRAYDEAVERAILKSSPLPRPDKPELFMRTLELRFRPLDP
ncbi:MAG: TonB C-terminal domain-containing protein [Betaproteobacteria bacterium]|nr:TonB C-terminal domain-containing protein [Betaproteobacteria bacterium]